MSDTLNFGHIIVGTGQATGTLLSKLIPTGESIAVIEGGSIGDTCVNVGCTPTKALVASAKVAHMVRRAAEYGVQTPSPSIDFGAVRDRMNRIRHNSRDGLTGFIENAENVTLIRGLASFESNHVVNVDGQRLEGEKIYINVGTRSATPPIAGLDRIEWLDNESLLDLDTLPEHLVIVGGGYIGIEFAQIFRRFGSEVTILQRSGQLMPREDADVALALQEILEDEGIQILLSADVRRVSRENDGISVSVLRNGDETLLIGSHLLLATGRRPNSDSLALENTDIEVNKFGYIQVDDVSQTGAPGVFALGDVNGHGAFTHTSVNDAEIVLDYLFGSRDGVGIRKISDRVPTYALFSDPPLGRVGMTEKEALDGGYKIMKAARVMSMIGRAKKMGETRGFAKLIVDSETDMILGASILGVGGDEIISMFAAIMFSQIPCKNYRKVVLVHPTVSELMPWILDSLEAVN
jgi:pyruvate/2-oxoglutarate dehydrogenase complex dihydrolipoamide dehydrogenase (E3) component